MLIIIRNGTTKLGSLTNLISASFLGATDLLLTSCLDKLTIAAKTGNRMQ